MSSHTAAPWIVVRELREKDEIVCDMLNAGWVIPANGQKLAPWDVDAALISASPDLLSALEVIVQAMQQPPDESGLHRIDLGPAIKAIEKARRLA